MKDMPSLSTLDLSQNKLTLEDVSWPEGLQLKWLFLEDNHIATIEKNTFASLTSLKVLLLHNNQVSSIHREAFHQLTELIEVNLSNNKIHNFPSQVFYNMCALAKLYFKKFHYCSFAPYVRICRPNTDGLSSTEHLLVRPVLRMSVWVVALVTCSGNSLVLFWRIIVRRRTEEYQITALFIKNLAVSDLLMGVYLVVIGAKDVAFRDEYNRHAHQWMSSWGCTACGVLAMLSCEVSILILTLMTMDRYLCFKCNNHRVTTNAALYSLAGIWLCGLVLALFPVIRWPHDRGFYSSNGLCFPLHIDDPYMLGWEFSTFVFLGVNFPAVLLMVVQYVWMFSIISRRMSKSQPGTLKPARYKDDTVVAFRCFFIVLTDCLCWVPIVIIKIVALCEITISENLFAWVVVFIVPINSALNPVIYTFGYRAREMKRLTQGVLQWCHKPMEQVWGPESKASVATQSTTVIESRSVSSGSILPHNIEASITVDINKSVHSASEECHPLKGQETEL
ncbi:relaxin receptor 1-like [Limulus polyphemus]|uniref:Relaxin receptor 1-like n=1 Tax=Limulus polyphemus TaxID=6850 RepID=A0ABM1SUN0_LIMPO|nr:relaxin receptor 1-like [Limulus polyphemus]